VLAYYERQVRRPQLVRLLAVWRLHAFLFGPAPRLALRLGRARLDNTELGASLWLWESFLRTGRADLFRLAEAHAAIRAKPTSITWADGRPGLPPQFGSMGRRRERKRASARAAHWRAFYYLTTDERIGDIMHEATMADVAARSTIPCVKPSR